MKDFSHENVVRLYGICLEGDDPPKVCLEFMDKGDLRSHLRRARHVEEGEEPVEVWKRKPFLQNARSTVSWFMFLCSQRRRLLPLPGQKKKEPSRDSWR